MHYLRALVYSWPYLIRLTAFFVVIFTTLLPYPNGYTAIWDVVFIYRVFKIVLIVLVATYL